MGIAIVAVSYNRPDSLNRLLESLQNAYYDEEVTLIISVDKSSNTSVEEVADAFLWNHGEKRVAKHDENLGLRKHMLSLGQYFTEFEALIILEDDITVSPSFYYYAKGCVQHYANDDIIAGISLYSFAVNYQNCYPFSPIKSAYDVYLMNCAQSWGEVWMRNSWQQFRQWYETHDEEFCLDTMPTAINRWPKSSWLKYHTRYCIETNKYFVFPYVSLSTNNGDPGINFAESDTMFQVELLNYRKQDFSLPPVDEIEIRYDGFFEPKFLGSYMHLDENALCVDLYGNKSNTQYRPYLLSLKSLPYEIVQSFSMHLRPIEMNIISHSKGSAIRLYNTKKQAELPSKCDPYQRYYYLYGKGFYNALFIMGPAHVLYRIADLLVYKINKNFHTKLPCHLK